MNAPELTAAPILETPRLILRAHRREDLDACAAMWGDPAMVRHISGRPSTRPEAWRRLLAYAGHWVLMGFGYWAVVEKASGRFIGDVGLSDFKRGVDPRLDDAPEIGWLIAPAAQGRGYATEAAHAALDWIEQALAPPRTACLIDPGNEASLRIAATLGYHETARVELNGSPALVLERSTPRRVRG